MRILCLSDIPFHGSGLSTLGKNVSDGLKCLGHEVIDLSLFDANSIDQFCQKQKWDIILGIGYWADAQRQISIPKKYNQKVVVYWVSEGNVPKFQDIIPNADLLLVTSEYSKCIFEKYVSDCKPKVIYPGVDTEFYQPMPKIGSKTFASFVSSGKVKGIDEALEACAILKKRGVDFTFVVHDPHITYSLEWEYMQGLKRKAKQLDLLKNAVFSESPIDLSKMPLIYNTLAFYLAPMRQACFGLPIAEAGACGVPTVGGNWQPINEQVIDGFNGRLFRGMLKIVEKDLENCHFSEEWMFGDPTDMAEKMEELLTNQSERYSFGVNSRKHVEENFNLKTQIKKLEEELLKI